MTPDDRYVTPCWEKPAAFDVMIHSDKVTREVRLAAVDASVLCGRCEIRDRCLTRDNKSERWAQLVLAVLKAKAAAKIATLRGVA